jgi:hypothetical protein
MKIVREIINEKFTENSDPIADMGIGNPMLRKLQKTYKELEKSLNYIDDTIDFHDIVTNKLEELKKIVVFATIEYFNEKYNTRFKLKNNIYTGNVFAVGNIEKYEIVAAWSNSGASVAFGFYEQNNAIDITPRCRTMKTLDNNFKKICKKLNIKI